VTSTEASETSPTETPVAAPAAATSDVKPVTKEKRRTSIFNSLGNKREKKAGEVGSEPEGAEGETKKSPLPQKIGDLFRKPSKAVKSESTQTEPTPAASESAAATTETAEGGAAATAPAATGETDLTNGTPGPAKDVVEPTPEPAAPVNPEVKASA
jgi:hypothetical protein